MHKKMSKHLKTLICLLAVVVLVLSNSSSVMADTSATNNQTDYRLVLEDDADFFTSDEESDLVDLMEDITIYGNVIVATSTSHSYYSSEDYAVAIYENKFGEDSDGVVFVIDRDLNNIYLACEGSAKKIITNSRCDVICDNTYIYATKDYGYDYYTCAYNTLEQVYTLLDGGKISQPMKYISNAILSVIIAMLINFIIVMTYARPRKPSARQLLNGTYTNVQVNNPSTRFVNQTRTYSPQSSGSSGGGGHSGGGGGGGHSGGGHSI